MAAAAVQAVRTTHHELVWTAGRRAPWWQGDPVASASRGIPTGPLRASPPADLWVTANCARVLSPQALQRPTIGVVNLHWSLLPLHRGPCPATAAILAGDTESGLTLHAVTSSIDGGPILAQARFPLGLRPTAPQVYRRAAELVPEVLLPYLAELEHSRALGGVPQSEAAASHHRRPTHHEARLDWTRPASELDRHVRALTSPMPWTLWRGREVVVSAGRCIPARCEAPPGTITRTHPVHVATGDGLLQLDRAWLRRAPWAWLPGRGAVLV